MKYILLIGDGMGDLPVASLGDKTPLEAAVKPAIDRLARKGEQLLVRTVPEGFPPGSDVANLSLLGYEPQKYYTGRAPLEAASMGVEIAPDEVAFRCNLVTIERSEPGRVIMRDYSAGHISSEEGSELIRAVQEQCGTGRLHLYPGVGYRHLMVHRGAIPSLTTVPPHDYLDQDVTGFYNGYLATVELKALLEESAQLLAQHPVNARRVREGKSPANSLWLWGEGRPLQMRSLEERYRVTGGLISAVDLIKGLGVCSGLEVINVPGATGYLDSNLEGKTRAALKILQDRDFVLVHVEAPDEAGHQGLAAEKVRAIEDFDSRIVGPIVEEMQRRDEPFRLVVTMDHFTPLASRTHAAWPVPMVLYDSRGVDQPSGSAYSEANAKAAVAANGLNLKNGTEFFSRFIGVAENKE